MKKLFTGPFILFAYLVGALSVFSGVFLSYIGLIIGLGVLFIWDILFVLDRESFRGRSINDTNDSVTRARTYISWYIGLYGVIIGLSLTKANELEQFSSALANSGTPTWLIALPLLLSIISMLFIPLQLGEQSNKTDPPNVALRSLFFLVVYLQKAILILIGNIGFRVMTAWP